MLRQTIRLYYRFIRNVLLANLALCADQRTLSTKAVKDMFYLLMQPNFEDQLIVAAYLDEIDNIGVLAETSTCRHFFKQPPKATPKFMPLVHMRLGVLEIDENALEHCARINALKDTKTNRLSLPLVPDILYFYVCVPMCWLLSQATIFG